MKQLTKKEFINEFELLAKYKYPYISENNFTTPAEENEKAYQRYIKDMSIPKIQWEELVTALAGEDPTFVQMFKHDDKYYWGLIDTRYGPTYEFHEITKEVFDLLHPNKKAVNKQIIEIELL